LRFVASATDADSTFPGVTVVLDPGWTPGPETGPDIASALPAFSRVLEKHDLFKESLDLVDAWADRAGIGDRLLVEGVSYWYRLRESMWHWVHERLLWRYTFEEMGVADGMAALSAPWTETALIDVATAQGSEVDIVGPPVVRPSLRTRALRLVPGVVRTSYRRIRPHSDTVRAERERAIEDARDAFLATRYDGLMPGPRRRVVVVSTPYSRHWIGSSSRGTTVDPNLGSVIQALRGAGIDPITIGFGIARGAVEFWPLVEATQDFLPAYFLGSRFSSPEDETRVAAALGPVRAQLEHALAPLDIDGVDVARPFLTALRLAAELTIETDVGDLACIERLFSELTPSAVLMSHEGHRIPWLVAAKRVDYPTFAVQHGVLYERHPGYPDHRDARHIRPSCTFVFGQFEQRVLRAIGYLPTEVAVSGSPRLDYEAAFDDQDGALDSHNEIRQSLGVAEGDRLLVVSTGYYPFMRRSHIAHMIATLLGGPLPGIHVVFKQHPAEPDQGPYRALLTGLARRGGYDPPAVSVVRDVDLYRLLAVADAHLGHQSTVLTDAVIAGTCNLVADVQASPPIIDYVGAGVGFPVRSVSDVRAAMREPPVPSEEARQLFIRDHFESGNAGQRIASAMADAAKAH
jgi:hypothetical protein